MEKVSGILIIYLECCNFSVNEFLVLDGGYISGIN